jgi:hypothetical protein
VIFLIDKVLKMKGGIFVENIFKERALKTGELKSLKGVVGIRVNNWVKIKLQLNTLTTETVNTYCKQMRMPAKDVKGIFLECLKESFDEILEQAKKKLEDLK